MPEPDRFPELPWGQAEAWHADVAVVGGGPAGLAAALRLRWMKSVPPVPLSVVLIASGPLGGLASLGNSILTGPGLAFPSGGLPGVLRQDLAAWPLPVLQHKAAGLGSAEGLFELTLEDGRRLRSLSLVVATGMLDLRNLSEFWGNGLAATFGSAGNILRVLEQALPKAQRPVVIGGPGVVGLAGEVARINPASRLLIPAGDGSTVEHGPAEGLEVIQGGLLEALAGDQEGLAGLRIRAGSGERLLETDLVVLEFNSLELTKPDRLSGLPVDAAGFLRVAGQNLQTSLPGLFGAGDCLGPPFSVVKALGQGAQAGFGAYRFAYERKYGRPPSLFAYYGDEQALLGPLDREYPVHENIRPVRLLAASPREDAADLWPFLDGRHTLSELSRLSGRSLEELYIVVDDLINSRAVTFASEGLKE